VAVGPPATTYTGPRPHRNAVDVFSLLSPRKPPGAAVALDLGCGAGQYRETFKALGYRYVGIDVGGSGPTLLADAHALPFKEGAFDVVFSMAVVEHVHNPFIALGEVYRVLKPGGLFVGIASFGEPFHGSYFHASLWGVASLMHATGFRLHRLWGCRDTLAALADMPAYPRAVRWGLRGVAALARLSWLSPRRRLSGADPARAALERAGSIGFHAQKPEGEAPK
jgi:SAM-dependent methyltransferase